MKRKVLHVISTMPVGGAEMVLLNTLKNLDYSRYESVVCCIQKKGVLGEEVEKLGFPTIELNKLKKGGWDGSIITDLYDLIIEFGVDLVHTHLYHANMYGRFAAKRAGIPAVSTIHNVYAKRKWHRQLINWYLGRYSAAIIAVSDAIRQDVIAHDHVAPEKVHVIRNGIDLNRSLSQISKDESRRRLGLGDGDFVMVMLGRLVEQKGHAVLFDAMSRLVSNYSRLKLIVIGDGPLKGELSQLADDRGLGEAIIFLGERTDIADIFVGADLFVMPSLWEGLGLALLEGMAAGLPVLASDTGGMAEILEKGSFGFTVPPGDSTALEEKIQFCIDNPAALSVGVENSLRRAMDFRAENMSRSIEKIYSSL